MQSTSMDPAFSSRADLAMGFPVNERVDAFVHETIDYSTLAQSSTTSSREFPLTNPSQSVEGTADSDWLLDDAGYGASSVDSLCHLFPNFNFVSADCRDSDFSDDLSDVEYSIISSYGAYLDLAVDYLNLPIQDEPPVIPDPPLSAMVELESAIATFSDLIRPTESTSSSLLSSCSSAAPVSRAPSPCANEQLGDTEYHYPAEAPQAFISDSPTDDHAVYYPPSAPVPSPYTSSESSYGSQFTSPQVFVNQDASVPPTDDRTVYYSPSAPVLSPYTSGESSYGSQFTSPQVFATQDASVPPTDDSTVYYPPSAPVLSPYTRGESSLSYGRQYTSPQDFVTQDASVPPADDRTVYYSPSAPVLSPYTSGESSLSYGRQFTSPQVFVTQDAYMPHDAACGSGESGSAQLFHLTQQYPASTSATVYGPPPSPIPLATPNTEWRPAGPNYLSEGGFVEDVATPSYEGYPTRAGSAPYVWQSAPNAHPAASVPPSASVSQRERALQRIENRRQKRHDPLAGPVDTVAGGSAVSAPHVPPCAASSSLLTGSQIKELIQQARDALYAEIGTPRSEITCHWGGKCGAPVKAANIALHLRRTHRVMAKDPAMVCSKWEDEPCGKHLGKGEAVWHLFKHLGFELACHYCKQRFGSAELLAAHFKGSA